MELINNYNLSLKELLHKRDLLNELIEMGYTLNTEICLLNGAIEKEINKMEGVVYYGK